MIEKKINKAVIEMWESEISSRLEKLRRETCSGNGAYTPEEIIHLRLQEWHPLTDQDLVPEEPVNPITKRGDVWFLERHRLMCGDSRSAKDVKKVMNGNLAALLFTDPPYGVGIGAKNRLLDTFGKAGERLEDIESDEISSPTVLKEVLLKAFQNVYPYLADNCSTFVCSPQGGELCMMMMMMIDANLPTKHIMIWKKHRGAFSLGRLDYEYQHEPILFSWKKSHKRHDGVGLYSTSIWEADRPTASKDHATTKPVDLPLNAILRHTDQLDIVVDIYMGSGTTLIAAHKAGRVCYGLEIEPRYVDVCLRRWSDFTGLDPIRESDGAGWSELKKKTPPRVIGTGGTCTG